MQVLSPASRAVRYGDSFRRIVLCVQHQYVKLVPLAALATPHPAILPFV